ncbi:hypothetical protein [Streptomyces albiflavescens]|nr:hypothetical protein [Streptomyces albiflavescens]
MSDRITEALRLGPADRVCADNTVTLCDLRVFVDEATEAFAPDGTG